MPQIKIYSTPACGYCHLLKEYLNKNNITYQDIDVSTDLEAQKLMIEKSGQMGVPVTIIEKNGQEKIIVGFQKEKIANLLDIKKFS